MAKSAKTQSTDGKHILIVEDERPLAHALELKLSGSGYHTTVASSGADALRELEQGSFDVILLDLILPGVDGFGVLKAVKEKKKSTPVIVLSNLGQEEDRERAKEYGVAEYCVKSNTPLSSVVDAVRRIVLS